MDTNSNRSPQTITRCGRTNICWGSPLRVPESSQLLRHLSQRWTQFYGWPARRHFCCVQFLIARSIQSICCCSCSCSSWINSKILLENSRNWKLSKLKVVRIECCQKCKLPKLQVAKIASCQNCKLPKLKIAKIASCQSWNWFFYFLLKVSIFDELSWKLPNCKLPKL